MINKIKLLFKSYSIQNADMPFVVKKDLIEEVRVKKAAWSQEQVCAMVPHEADCDIFSCQGGCFKRVPDKIMGSSYSVDPITLKRIE